MSGLWMLLDFVLPEALPRRPRGVDGQGPSTKIHPANLAAWLLAAMTLPSTDCCGGGLEQRKNTGCCEGAPYIYDPPVTST